MPASTPGVGTKPEVSGAPAIDDFLFAPGEALTTMGQQLREMGKAMYESIKAIFMLPIRIFEAVIVKLIEIMPKVAVVGGFILICWLIWRATTGVNVVELGARGVAGAGELGYGAGKLGLEAGGTALKTAAVV